VSSKPPAENLRAHPNHRERGPRTFSYTYADLASLLGVTEAAVRQAAYRKSFDPSNLQSVIAYYLKRVASE